MSRIHDALKKAEQERGANPSVGSSELDELVLAPAAVSAPVLDSVPVGMPASVPLPSRHGSSDPLQGSVRREWKPSPSMLFFDNTVHDAIGMEEFRTLRSRLYHIRERKPIKTILVGSALPGEGKTYVAANLAQVLARQRGRRTLLIDGDLRRPRLQECFGAEAAPGLSDYLRGEKDFDAIMQLGPLDGLYFVPAGTHVSNPAELIANGRLKQLIESASAMFDWIIIDTAPVVPVSDSVVLASCCDGILLVVQASQTTFEFAQRGVQEFGGVPVLGVVLNEVDPRSGYSSYQYQYRKTPGKES